MELPIESWFDEEGVDEEEIKKRILDQIQIKNIKLKKINIQRTFIFCRKKNNAYFKLIKIGEII